MKKYQCPCCGYFTYNVPANEDCGYICPVCFWEDDPAAYDEPSDDAECNGVSLLQAKANYLAFGACCIDMVSHVRRPNADELTGIE